MSRLGGLVGRAGCVRGQRQGQRGGSRTHQHARPAGADEPPHRDDRGGGRGRDQVQDQGRGLPGGDHPTVGRGRRAGVEVVVDVGLVGPRDQRPAEAPEHEPAGERGVRRHGRPEREAAGVQRGAQDQQAAPRHGVGPGAGRYLEQDVGRRPDDEQRRDLAGRQPRVGEQQGVHREDRDELAQRGVRHHTDGERVGR